MKIILALMFVLMSLNPYAHAEYTNDELAGINLRSLHADFTKDTAYSLGTGRIIHYIPNAIPLARRAALADAQRGLLILRRELKEGRPRTNADVSGHVPPVKIISEHESGDIYVVEVEAVLSELMRDESKDVITEEGEDDYDENDYDDEYKDEEREERKEREDYDDGDDFIDVRTLLNRRGRK